MRKIPHHVLNAKLHQKEALIVAEAGKSTMGQVYIVSDGKAFTDKPSAIRYQQSLINDATEQKKKSDPELVGKNADSLIHNEERLLGAVTIATNMARPWYRYQAHLRGEGRGWSSHHRHDTPREPPRAPSAPWSRRTPR